MPKLRFQCQNWDKETVTKGGRQLTKLVDKEEIIQVNEEKQIYKQLWTIKKELNASTYPIYLFLFQRFECTTLIIKELLLNLLHFIFTNIAIFIKP